MSKDKLDIPATVVVKIIEVGYRTICSGVNMFLEHRKEREELFQEYIKRKQTYYNLKKKMES